MQGLVSLLHEPGSHMVAPTSPRLLYPPPLWSLCSVRWEGAATLRLAVAPGPLLHGLLELWSQVLCGARSLGEGPLGRCGCMHVQLYVFKCVNTAVLHARASMCDRARAWVCIQRRHSRLHEGTGGQEWLSSQTAGSPPRHARRSRTKVSSRLRPTTDNTGLDQEKEKEKYLIGVFPDPLSFISHSEGGLRALICLSVGSCYDRLF